MKEWREMWNGPKRTIYYGIGFSGGFFYCSLRNKMK